MELPLFAIFVNIRNYCNFVQHLEIIAGLEALPYAGVEIFGKSLVDDDWLNDS